MTITEKDGVRVIASYETASCKVFTKGMSITLKFDLIEHLHHSVMAEILSNGEEKDVIDKS
jgi:hypothetical protein